jgi:hypothetical protein
LIFSKEPASAQTGRVEAEGLARSAVGAKEVGVLILNEMDVNGETDQCGAAAPDLIDCALDFRGDNQISLGNSGQIAD